MKKYKIYNKNKKGLQFALYLLMKVKIDGKNE